MFYPRSGWEDVVYVCVGIRRQLPRVLKCYRIHSEQISNLSKPSRMGRCNKVSSNAFLLLLSALQYTTGSTHTSQIPFKVVTSDNKEVHIYKQTEVPSNITHRPIILSQSYCLIFIFWLRDCCQINVIPHMACLVLLR